MDFFSGIDLVEIPRIEKSLKNELFLKRVFSEKEQALFLSKQGLSQRTATIAGNFATKEAFSKVLGTGIRGFSLDEVSVLRDELGAPYLELSGKAKLICEERGLRFSVSLTHTEHYAVAVVIAFSD